MAMLLPCWSGRLKLRRLKNRIASSRNAAKGIYDLCQPKSESLLRSAN